MNMNRVRLAFMYLGALDKCTNASLTPLSPHALTPVNPLPRADCNNFTYCVACNPENYQQKDGTVIVPEALRQYMGVEVIR
ncbi:MAG: hypothetical protein ACOYU2_10495 [Nitrospirota bacterium]